MMGVIIIDTNPTNPTNPNTVADIEAQNEQITCACYVKCHPPGTYDCIKPHFIQLLCYLKLLSFILFGVWCFLELLPKYNMDVSNKLDEIIMEILLGIMSLLLTIECVNDFINLVTYLIKRYSTRGDAHVRPN